MKTTYNGTRHVAQGPQRLKNCKHDPFCKTFEIAQNYASACVCAIVQNVVKPNKTTIINEKVRDDVELFHHASMIDGT